MQLTRNKPVDQTNSRKKILFLISEFTYVRNYLFTDALSLLMRHHEVKFAVSKDILEETLPLSNSQVIGTFEYRPREVKLQSEIFQILAWRHRKKSRTFFYRWLRQTNWNNVERQSSRMAKLWALATWVVGVLSRRTHFIGPLLGNKLAFRFGLPLLISRHDPNNQLREIIDSEHWDLIAIPTAAFEPATFDALYIAKKKKIPTLALIDNWDNLVSKTVFWTKPDKLGVWGRQAIRHAIEVQGFSEGDISAIGTPRFDQYFSGRKALAKERGEYVLFVGSAMPFDEITALHLLESELMLLGLESLPIIYRPHPWQQKRMVPSIFKQDDFRNTFLDDQILSAQRKGLQKSPTDTRFQPNLSHYPGLFQRARIVIGPLTTMLLEASICLRPVIGISYDDGAHFTTSVEYFSHFQGMESVPGFQFCERQESLGTCLQNALNQPPIDMEDLDSALSEFLVIDERTYPERLLNLTDGIIRP